MKIYYKKLSLFLCVLLLVATLLVSIPPPAKASGMIDTTTVLVISPHDSSVYGEYVLFVGTVHGYSSSSQPETVTFHIGNYASFNATISGNQAAIALTDLPVGTYQVYAEYGGDSTYKPSTSGILNHQVEKAQTTLNMSISPNPAVYGQPITFTADVRPVAPGAGTPTGKVNFLVVSPNSSILSFVVDLDGSGRATKTYSFDVIGSYTISAFYLGDSNFLSSVRTPVEFNITKASTVTKLTSRPNPSDNGQTVEFTAETTAVSPGAGVPTGSVVFLIGGGISGSAPLVDGKAVFSTSTLPPPGQISAIANYEGDDNFNMSTSPEYTQVIRAETSISLESNKNPSNQNDSVTFTASGLPPDATGNVTFYDGGGTLGISAVSGGSASLAVSSLTAGAHQITARYGGDSSYMPSVSPALTQTVQSPYTYTVRYLNVLSGKPIAPDTSGAGQLGDKVTVTAPKVSGFILQDASEKTITITAGNNSAEFLYVPVSAIIVFAAFLLLFALIGIFAIILQARVQ